jgi:hypothetical protein
LRELAQTLPTVDGGQWTPVSERGLRHRLQATSLALNVRNAIALGATGPLPVSPGITVGVTLGCDDEGTLLRRPTLRGTG